MKKRFVNKKGQVTIFIIIAIVIIAAIIAYISITQLSKKEIIKEDFADVEINAKIDNIKNYYLSCAQDVSLSSLNEIGEQGGYYDEPENSYDLGWKFLPYYYLEGEFLMPDKKTIENELSKYVNNNLKFCLQEAKYPDFKLEYEEPQTTVSIMQDQVIFNIDLPLTITKEGKSIVFDLKEHPINQVSALEDMLEIATFLTESHKESTEMICISCLTDMADEREIYVDMTDFADATTMQIVISENRTSEEPYLFTFLNKYKQEE